MSKNLSYEEFEGLYYGDVITIVRTDSEYTATFEGLRLDGEGNQIMALYNEDTSQECFELVEEFGSDYSVYKDV